MKALITGGGGYLGLVLARTLLDRGWSVRIVDRFLFGRSGAESLAGHEPGAVEIVTGDVRGFDPGWLEDVSAVAHLAAISSDPSADHAPQEAWAVNATPTERMIALMRQSGVRRCVYASTASAYDGNGALLCTETTPIAPKGAYTLSKIAAENTLLEAASDDFAVTSLRMGTLFGPSPRMRFDLVVNAFVRSVLLGGEVNVFGDGAMSRPLLAVEDAAAAFAAVLEAPPERMTRRIFNVVGENRTVREVADETVAICTRERRAARVVLRPVPERVRDYRASAAAIRAELGWTPRIELGASIVRMLNFYELLPPNVLTDPASDNVAFVRQYHAHYKT